MGTTVLLATHQMHTADALCDRAAVVDSGRIVEYDTPHALKLRYGARRLRLEAISDGVTCSRSLSLDDPDTAEEVASLIRRHALVSLHTEEATLDDVFRQLTGKALAHAE
ncbi:MAG: hypothetical protein HYX56_02530 [Chloroflexi bacterium]|nr:hypothetical protein [Chloroflexota bacterium]